jgi:sugar/nucleoside kinase (ribokinase family)
MAVKGETEARVPIARIGKGVIDTTGAGDLFAAGFLVGQARGLSLEESLRIGSIAAAEVISHFGARPEADLKGLVGL